MIFYFFIFILNFIGVLCDIQELCILCKLLVYETMYEVQQQRSVRWQQQRRSAFGRARRALANEI